MSPVWAALIAIGSIFLLIGRFPMDPEEALSSVAGLWQVTLTVSTIMLTGIILTSMQNVSGAQRSVNDWLNLVVESPERSVLFYGITVVPLIESLIGWGLGVVTGIPLLLGVGLSKTKAVQIGLLGLMLCPWGAFSPALIFISEVTGIAFGELGVATAWFNLPVLAILSGTIVLVYGGLRVGARMWIEAGLIVTVMGVVLILSNSLTTPALSGILASLAAASVLMVIARWQHRRSFHLPRLARRGLIPYGIVLVGLMACNAVEGFLSGMIVMDLLTNPAIWLMFVVFLSPSILRLSWIDLRRALRMSFTAWFPVCAVTVLLILFGTLLTVNGMSETLAEGATRLGGLFILIVPLVGFIGGFVTSSNTAAAAMFTEPITAAAISVGANPIHVLGMQTAVTGAAVMCAPSRAVLAIETGNMMQRGQGEHVSVMTALKPAFMANGVIVLVSLMLAWLVL